jgi:hypothetical protein
VQVGARSQKRIGEPCACVEQVFAVVQYQEQMSGSQADAERFGCCLAGGLSNAHRGCRAMRYEVSIGERTELYQPHSIWKQMDDRSGELQRQPRLPAAAHARQRQQPRIRTPSLQLRQLPLPPDEARQQRWQIVAKCTERRGWACHANQ